MANDPVQPEKPVNLPGPRPTPPTPPGRGQSFLVVLAAAGLGFVLVAVMYLLWFRPPPEVALVPSEAEKALLPTLADIHPAPLPLGQVRFTKERINRSRRLQYQFDPAEFSPPDTDDTGLRQALAENIGKPLPVKMISILHVDPSKELAEETYNRLLATWLTDIERQQPNGLPGFADQAFATRLGVGYVEQGGFAIFRIDNKVLLTMFYGLLLPADQKWSSLLQPYRDALQSSSFD